MTLPNNDRLIDNEESGRKQQCWNVLCVKWEQGYLIKHSECRFNINKRCITTVFYYQIILVGIYMYVKTSETCKETKHNSQHVMAIRTAHR